MPAREPGLRRCLAAGPGAMPPDGRPARSAAHGRVPARPGSVAGRAVCEPRRKWRDAGSTSAEQVGTSGRAARAPRENLRLGLGAAPRTWLLESALQRTRPPPGRGAPGASGGWPPGRAEVRPGGCPRRQPRGPRGTNRRNGSGRGEGAGGQGPGAGRAAGPAPSRARSSAQSPSLPPRTAGASLSRAGGREWSRELRARARRRPRSPGHVPLRRPISPGGRGDVTAAALRMTAGPPSRGPAHANGRHRGGLRFPAARAAAVVGW